MFRKSSTIPYLFLLPLLFLSTCSSLSNTPHPAPVMASPTAAPQLTMTEDPVLAGIQFSLNSGGHAFAITCEDCHEGSAAAEKERSLTAQPGQSGSSIPGSKCLNCHPAQSNAAPVQDGSLYAHTNFACTDCHNPHSVQASCTQSACHYDINLIFSSRIEMPDNHPTMADTNTHMCNSEGCHNAVKAIAASPIYHQPVHSEIPCHVCHDATGLETGQNADHTWVSLNGSEQPLISHMIRREVICTRCHFPANPWGLIEAIPAN